MATVATPVISFVNTSQFVNDTTITTQRMVIIRQLHQQFIPIQLLLMLILL